jgi:phosphate transport system protein
MVDVGDTATAFDSDLQAISIRVLEMGGLVEAQVLEAIQALRYRNQKRGRQVVAEDAGVDLMQREIEEAVVEMIARRQPVANDMRQAIAILRIAADLERVGDLAKNIGKRIGVLERAHLPRQFMEGVIHIATLILSQLNDVLDSFANRDVAKAVEVWTRDQEIDRLYTSLYRELLTLMVEHSNIVTFAVHLVFCIKNIERIGDHATNIAESIYYMVQGHVLRGERPKADLTVAITSRVPSTSPMAPSISEIPDRATALSSWQMK